MPLKSMNVLKKKTNLFLKVELFNKLLDRAAESTVLKSHKCLYHCSPLHPIPHTTVQGRCSKCRWLLHFITSKQLLLFEHCLSRAAHCSLFFPVSLDGSVWGGECLALEARLGRELEA